MRKLIAIFTLAALALAAWLLRPGRRDDFQKKAAIRDAAYFHFGTGLLKAMEGSRLPYSHELKKFRPFELGIDWAAQARENSKKFPYHDWQALKLQNGYVRRLVFNPRFVPGSAKWYDGYFNGLAPRGARGAKDVAVIRENEQVIRHESAVLVAAWPAREVQLAYFPGKILSHGGTGSKLGPDWLEAMPEEMKNGERGDFLRAQDPKGLLALLNGGFMQADNEIDIVNKKGKPGGLGFAFKEWIPPQDEMATLAIEKGGRLRLGAWKNIKKDAPFLRFRQNRYMVIEGGKPARDAHPTEYNRPGDLIVRSYLFKARDGWLGYLWTAWLPPEVLAPLCARMGIIDMMLLDIHSVINCTLLTGEGPKGGHLQFVPQLWELTRANRLLIGLSKLSDNTIQDDYMHIAFKSGEKDWIGVYAKDAPDALRLRAESPGEAEP